MSIIVSSSAARPAEPGPAGRAWRCLPMLAAAVGLACSSPSAAEPGGEGGMGAMGGAESSEDQLVAMTCPAGGVCEFLGLTLFTEAAVAVTFDPDPRDAPGGYAVVAGFPEVQLGLTGHALPGPVLAVFDLGDEPRGGDLVVVLDSGDGPTILSSEFVQETLVTEVSVGGQLQLVRIVPDLPEGCSETWHPGGSFDLSDLGDLSAVTHIEQDLTLEGPLPEKLDALSCLVFVGGDLSVSATQGLVSLGGLAHLTIVGGGLSIDSNPDLVDANLPGLEGRVTRLIVAENPRLEFFGAGDLLDVLGPLTIATNGQESSSLELDLFFLRRVRGHADFIDNAGWRMNRSLASLETIEGRLMFLQNDALETLDDLSSLTSVGGDLEIGQSPQLHSLAGLANLRSVGANVRIHDNPRLEVLDLREITSVSGALSLGYNGSAAPELDIDLGALEIVHGALELVYNRHWDLQEGLASLRAVEGAVSIRENSALVSLSGLATLRSIGGALSIDNNLELQDVRLPSLDAVLGGVAIHSHAKLSQIELTALASVDGDLVLAYNGATSAPLNLNLGGVTLVHGQADIVHNAGSPLTISLAQLTAVEGQLSLSHNDGFYGATGTFAALERVEGALLVTENTVMVTPPFPQLSTVGAGLELASNGQLTSLTGLALLEEVGGTLSLLDNPLLPSCAALALVDQLEETGWAGSSVVLGNGPDDCSP